MSLQLAIACLLLAALQCRGQTPSDAVGSVCKNGLTRLVGGSSNSTGILEICREGTWTSVCRDSVDAREANLICKHMGFLPIGAQIESDVPYDAPVPGSLSLRVECNRADRKFLDCNLFPQGNRRCSSTTVLRCSPCLPSNSPNPKLFYCPGGTVTESFVECIYDDKRCDNILDCIGGEDEHYCESCSIPEDNGKVKLTDAWSLREGRLEMCMNGQWGTVCSNGFDTVDAAVVCKQLGFPTSRAKVQRFASADAAVPIWFDRVECTGSEDSILQCGMRENPQCRHSQDVGIMCLPECTTDGALRLVNGSGPHEGRVEVCLSGHWGTICDEEWDQQDAQVVCRQAGYDARGAIAYQGALFGTGSILSSIVLSRVRCTGDEENLLECLNSKREINCTQSGGAAVSCAACNVDQYICSLGTLTGSRCINSSQICDGVADCVGGEDEQGVRLVDGVLPMQGRVEHCSNGEWHTICHDWWDNNDAKVVCRQLGYESQDARSQCCAAFGQGPQQQPIFQSRFHCNGQEKNISQCLTGSGRRCSHGEDAGVICRCDQNTYPCYGTSLENPVCITELQFCDGIPDCPQGSDEPDDCTEECSNNGEIRLIGPNENQGRVEICFKGRWGSVCDDSWDYYDAAVVCKQLGFGTLGAIARTSSFFGRGEGPVHLDNVYCQGTESTLIDCNRDRFGLISSNCRTHAEDASVICPTICPDRLYQCDYGRIDGLKPGCITNEQRCDGVIDCNGGDDEMDHNCPCAPEGAVRLVGGIVPYRGRVEFCLNTRWSSLCSYSWDYNDASVVCNQLGYPREGARTSCCSFFGLAPKDQPIFKDRLNCRGNERNLHLCPRRIGRECPATQHIGVICSIAEQAFPCSNTAPHFLSNVTELQFCDGKNDCLDISDEPSYCPNECSQPGQIRLMVGEQVGENKGRVEICFGGRWGTICDDSWDSRDAEVVCRQLGMGSAGATAYGGSRYNPGSGPLHLDDVACSGSEQNINGCGRSDYGYVSSNCRSHFEDASVFCPTVCPDDKFQCNHGIIGDNQSRCISTEQRCDGVTDCIGGDDELDYNCPCEPEGAVRLVDGIVPYRGRVEVCRGKRWRTICGSRWDTRDAAVVCRQLGYPTEGAEGSCCYRYTGAPVEQPVIKDHYNCRGSERNLSQCSISFGYYQCSHSRDVYVSCRTLFDEFQCSSTPQSSPSNVTELQFCDGVSNCINGSDEPQYCTAECLEPGKIRIMVGEQVGDNEGRVEICFGGRWGTICDDSWDYHDAEVVCRQLGMGSIGAIPYGGSRYNPGPGPLHLDDVACSGLEQNINECSRSNYGYVSSNCRSHFEDASVFCPTVCPDDMFQCNHGKVDDKESRCISTEQRCDGVTDCIGGDDELDHNCPCEPEGAVRLVDGILPYRGRVEVCQLKRWRTICSYYGWNAQDAAVVCRQLGYPAEGAEGSCCSRYTGAPDEQPVIKDNYNCQGTERNLSQCSTSIGYYPECGHNRDAFVICSVQFNNYQCTNTPNHMPSNVTEFQFCDGIANCINGTDEPEYCPAECQEPGKMRLINNGLISLTEGRVEICFGGEWGTICDDGWDHREAEVVCRQLGLGTRGAVHHNGAYYGPGTGRVHMDDVVCSGSEATLTNCQFRSFGYITSNCRSHLEDASVVCSSVCPDSMLMCVNGRVDGQQPPCVTSEQRCDGVIDCIGGEDEEDYNCPCEPEWAVRVVGNLIPFPYQGRVEVCVNGTWSTVCTQYYYNWRSNEASVVCRQLGYPTAAAEAHRYARHGRGNELQPIFQDRIQCIGNERNLSECRIIPDNYGYSCTHSHDASITCGSSEDEFLCSNPPLNTPSSVSILNICDGVINCADNSDESLCPDSECTEVGEVRLVQTGAERPRGTEGVVEICIAGRWSTITCISGSWGYEEAQVVCRQLGYRTSDALGSSLSFDGKTPIISNVVCEGSESTLLNCSKNFVGDTSSICGTTVATVTCVSVCPEHTVECSAGRVDGRTPPCVSIDERCDGEVQCIGGEDELEHNCPCSPEGEVRLAGGIVPYRGRVEICKRGQWFTICGYYWDNSDAAVVCRQLGYPTQGAQGGRMFQTGHIFQPMHFYWFGCSGRENSLLECRDYIAQYCNNYVDASVTCMCQNTVETELNCKSEFEICDNNEETENGTDEDPDCHAECSTPGEIRLVNGDKINGHEGRVEVCFQGRWGTVCDSSWDNVDAQVVCRQLGFGTTGATALSGSYYGRGSGPIYLDGVRCSGQEGTITDCIQNVVGDVSSRCLAHTVDAAVRCTVVCSENETLCRDGRVDDPKSFCISTEQRCDGVIDCVGGEDEYCPNSCSTNGTVRLVGGWSPHEGRVELCSGGEWTRVCDRNSRRQNAQVICRQLGYPTENANSQCCSTKFGFRYENQPSARETFSCSGNEMNITQCTRTSFDRTCGPIDDVLVTCGCSEPRDIPCSNDSPSCVSELQLCDGVFDCPEGIDEQNCGNACTTPGQIRLVDSYGRTGGVEGRVEICFKGEWGTICDDSWDYFDAQVVCRQLRYGVTGAIAYSRSHYGPGSGNVYLDDLNCAGSEDALVNCTRMPFSEVSSNCYNDQKTASVLCRRVCPEGMFECRYNGSNTTCLPNEKRCDGRVDCLGGVDEFGENCPCTPEGGVRLVDGIVPYRGRVEFCVDGTWTSICSSGWWDSNDASVVCRQLGYNTSGEASCCGRIFPGTKNPQQPVLRDRFYCEGTEKKLTECVKGAGYECGHANDVYVICTTSDNNFICSSNKRSSAHRVKELQFCDGNQDCINGSDEPQSCTKECQVPGELRLVEGGVTGGLRGRVEICFGGKWGTVCDNNWSYREAEVVCRQLGFGSRGAVGFRTHPYFNPESSRVLLDQVLCLRSENSLSECSSRPFGVAGSSCRTRPAAVICPSICPDNTTECRYGRVDGQQPPCISNHQLCDGTPDCIGGEDELDINCPCSSEGAVRLVDGNAPHQGRLELCIIGRWSTVCDYYYWTQSQASVVCRQLGYSISGTLHQSFGTFGTRPSQQKQEFDLFRCNGDEQQLTDCRRDRSTRCYRDVEVICSCEDVKMSPCTFAPNQSEPVCINEFQFCDGNRDCPSGSDETVDCAEECSVPGEIRLVNDGSTGGNQGRVEICKRGKWGTICDDQWSFTDAEVVCRQVGFGSRGAIAYSGSHFGPGEGPVHLNRVRCSGLENNLTECGEYSFVMGASSRCRDHSRDASVLCPTECPDDQFTCSNGRCDGQEPACIPSEKLCDGINDCSEGEDELDYNCPCSPEGAARLVDGVVPHRGRVEFCRNARWTTICYRYYYYYRNIAPTVCRQLGYSSEGSQIVYHYGPGPERQSLYQGYFSCSSDANNLTQCQLIESSAYCGHGQDIGVVCECPLSNQFPCKSSNGSFTCISELKYCDDTPDCDDGSDEPSNCFDECSRPGQLRLVNEAETNPHVGRLEICFKGQWGSICHDNWNYFDTEVACKQLGLGTVEITSFTGARYGRGLGPVHLNNLRCTGLEESLVECQRSRFGQDITNCRDHSRDIAISCGKCPNTEFMCGGGRIDGQEPACISSDKLCDGISDCSEGEDELDYNCPCSPEGAARLVDGVVPHRGRVEFCRNARWTTICYRYYYYYYYNFAPTVCRQLGYPSEDSEGVSSFGPGPARQSVFQGRFTCNTDAENLTQCVISEQSSCDHSRDIGVICECPMENQFPCKDTEGSIVCLSELQFCDGTLDCGDGSDEPSDCLSECTRPGQLRLVNGAVTDGHQGRVEICFKGQWGSICQDSWDYYDTEVACRQLELGTIEAVSYTGARYGRGLGPVFLNNLRCSGMEANLTDCQRSRFGQDTLGCRDHAKDVSVLCGKCPDGMFECKNGRVDAQNPPCISREQRCDNITDCLGGKDELEHNCPCSPEGAVRLVGGSGPHEGRVEFCRKSVWATVCDRYFQWWRGTAAVVCHQLGFSSQGAQSPRCCTTFFGAGPTTQLVDQASFSCSGGEATLSECRQSLRNSGCSHFYDAGIICQEQ